MHTPAALTSPNIFSQNRKAKRNKPASYDLDNQHHRIQIRDIVAAKQVNEKEIQHRRSEAVRDAERRYMALQSRKEE